MARSSWARGDESSEEYTGSSWGSLTEEYHSDSDDLDSSSVISSEGSEVVYVTRAYKRRKLRPPPPRASAGPKPRGRRRAKKPHPAKSRRRRPRALKAAHVPRAARRGEVRAAVAEAALDIPDSPSALSPSAPFFPTTGVYAIQTLTGNAPTFYVGKSGNIPKRLQDHRAGAGTPFLAGCEFTQVPLLTEGSKLDLESWERNETLRRMLEFGVDNVRGWMFTDLHLKAEDKRAAFQQICEKFDLCRRCGRGSHFRSECFAKSAAPWASDIVVTA